MAVITRRRAHESSRSLSPPSSPPSTKSSSTSAADAHTLLFVLSLTLSALTVLKILVYLPSFTETGNKAAFVAISIMAFVVCSIYRSMIRLKYKTSLLSVFLCVATFTAACDLGIAGYLVGVWDLGSFYPSVGEPYFASCYGVACLSWDGVFHLLIQSSLCYTCLRGKKLGPAAFVWAGSVINSMIPLLMGGAATGIFSGGVEASTAMNAPYVLIPVVIAHTLYDERAPSRCIRRGAKLTCKKDDMLPSIHSLLLCLTHACMVLIHIWRSMAVLQSDAPIAMYWLKIEPGLAQNDGTNVILLDTLQSLFWLCPYHLYSVYEAYSRAMNHCRSILANAGDWSSLVLGAYLQSSFIRVFMTFASYSGPGLITYSFHTGTFCVSLFVISVAAFHAWSMHDE